MAVLLQFEWYRGCSYYTRLKENFETGLFIFMIQKEEQSMATVEVSKLHEVALRIREMREIASLTEEEMAKLTDISLEEYRLYESGRQDFPFTFIHKCSLAFGIGITDLLEGKSARLSSYTVTRKGQGQETAKENGITI
ncbi:MAG: helix-turn-helix transcriptional regulator, partial [Bacteroidales bacterium]|nr:helix-turn-helix transcriptional regulator [Bacteroidales bacterium]